MTRFLKYLLPKLKTIIITLTMQQSAQLWLATEEDGHLASLLFPNAIKELVPIRAAGSRSCPQSRHQILFVLLVHQKQGQLEANRFNLSRLHCCQINVNVQKPLVGRQLRLTELELGKQLYEPFE